MSNEIMQENTPFVECSAFHRGMSVLEASLRNTEDSEANVAPEVVAEVNRKIRILQKLKKMLR